MSNKIVSLLTGLLLSGLLLSAQIDSLSLVCPLDHGVPRIIRASDRDYQKSSEYGVMITSKTDTIVKAVHQGLILVVNRTEDSKFDVLLFYKEMYFWYAGVKMPKVTRGTRVKAGDVIGTYEPGDLLELMMFEFDEPINPRRFLKCN